MKQKLDSQFESLLPDDYLHLEPRCSKVTGTKAQHKLLQFNQKQITSMQLTHRAATACIVVFILPFSILHSKPFFLIIISTGTV
jgi:hypothetical protein